MPKKIPTRTTKNKKMGIKKMPEKQPETKPGTLWKGVEKGKLTKPTTEISDREDIFKFVAMVHEKLEQNILLAKPDARNEEFIENQTTLSGVIKSLMTRISIHPTIYEDNAIYKTQEEADQAREEQGKRIEAIEKKVEANADRIYGLLTGQLNIIAIQARNKEGNMIVQGGIGASSEPQTEEPEKEGFIEKATRKLTEVKKKEK